MLVSQDFTEHNKKMEEVNRIKKEKQDKEQPCGYCKLLSMNLKNLAQMYTHSASCELSKKIII